MYRVHCSYHRVGIIESVDSICRDSADTQYMLIQTNSSKSPKQLTYKPLLHPTVHLRVFSWRKTHPVALKGIAKVPNQKVARRPKCFSFFFFFFRRASSNLRDSFTMVFAQNSSIFHWVVHQPIAFEVTRGDSNRSLKNYGFLYDAIFSSRVRMRTITLNFALWTFSNEM